MTIANCQLCGDMASATQSKEQLGHYVHCLSCGCSSGYFFDAASAISSWNAHTHRKPRRPKQDWLHAQCGQCGYLFSTRDGLGNMCRHLHNQAGVLDNDPACPDFRRRS